MIRRVQHIKEFGVFADFQWPAGLPEFKQFNLIYGWNYSGKTTLSRAFRCFEQKQPHVDFAGAQVQLKSENGTVHHLSAPHLFSTLYHFDKAGGADFDCLLSLPNVVRRFMEAFGGIMIPLSTGLKGKMERLFADEIERERVWKFVNHYSHNTTITRSLTIPDTSECKAVVQACLKAVRDWDADYFKDLEVEVS
jgi:wobble nucleotide-excising tRNase